MNLQTVIVLIGAIGIDGTGDNHVLAKRMEKEAPGGPLPA